MKTETYLHRLSRMAHWLLSPGEATEVIDDYTELLSTKNRSDTDLYKNSPMLSPLYWALS